MKSRKRILLIPTALSLTAGALILSLRLWNKRFVSVEVEKIPVEVQGEFRPGRRVTVQSIFNLPPQDAWQLVQTPRLLSQVARPVIMFTGQDGQPLPDAFTEGQTLHLQLRGLGVLPLGGHTIIIDKIDPARFEIQSTEHGQIAQTWRHFISIRPYGQVQTLYTDQVDLYAGEQTAAVAAFARLFYMYRQTRWHQLYSLVPRPS
jgi:hypothetical protein